MPAPRESKPSAEMIETIGTDAPEGTSSLESVMAEYVEKMEAGTAPDPAAYLAAYPMHADELRSFFRNHHWLGEEPAPGTISLVGKRIGPYCVEIEIARGGMGVVYRARQQELNRSVALKLISSGVLACEEERKRFRIEAEAAARLNHPGIIAIYETGTWEGHEYFSMAFVDGPTLQQRVSDGLFEDLESARLVRDVAHAVAYAHHQGITHRDLKPDNILISEDGRPLVTDFGLAKWQRDGSVAEGGLTRTGQVLGTPHYMSPEQAAGRPSGPASDIYSLGAILYALLTGRPPHTGNSAAEIIRHVLQDEPESPRSVRREIHPDLERICLQAMRFEPAQRYETATAFADDLDRFLAGKATRAVGSGLLDRVARELRRDQHQDYFVNWGRTLVNLGVIIFVSHLAIYFLALKGFPPWQSHWMPRGIMLATLCAQIYYARGGVVLPRTVAERPVFSIWIGYLLSLSVFNAILAIKGLDPNLLFPASCALSGFGFIAMSGHIWGGSAVFGLGFFVTAVVAAQHAELAPLLLGGMWLLSLLGLGRHYRSRLS